MSFKKTEIVKVEPLTGKRITSGGKREIVGSRLTNRDGETRVVLNPAGKAAKFAKELKENKRYTNSGTEKKDYAGKPLKLTKAQRRYRKGYLDARRDNSKAFKAKRGGGK